jgi:hypothetical protein
MCNLTRKLLRRARQKPSGPVLELRSRFPRKFILRSLANHVKCMGTCIPHTPPRPLQVQERQNGESRFPHRLESRYMKPNPAKQLFAQLSKKLDKLETLNSLSAKSVLAGEKLVATYSIST